MAGADGGGVVIGECKVVTDQDVARIPAGRREAPAVALQEQVSGLR
jgi:hypothetical protein